MLDLADEIQTLLTTLWEEEDPLLASLTFRLDEFDLKSPNLQIILENLPDRKIWVSETAYRIEHDVRMTLTLKPIRYDLVTIVAGKVTFVNAKTEIDRILFLSKFTTPNVNNLDMKNGWDDANSLAVGRGDKVTTEPILWKSIQIVTGVYYGGIPEEPS